MGSGVSTMCCMSLLCNPGLELALDVKPSVASACTPTRLLLRPLSPQGRATIDMNIRYKEPREDNSTGGVMRIVVDGFNAPVSAGCFVDLVKRGFYDGMEIQRADGFVVQTGDPEGEVRRDVMESAHCTLHDFRVLLAGACCH